MALPLAPLLRSCPARLVRKWRQEATTPDVPGASPMAVARSRCGDRQRIGVSVFNPAP